MKKRVLSGTQPSGSLHIGNYFGMIKRMIEYQDSSDLFCFIVNLHSLTTLHDASRLRKLTLEAAMDFLALGLDPKKCCFWAQSDVPEVTELMWILSCVTPMGLLERAHGYKDKLAKGIAASNGLFSYPILMAADILINQAQVIPVGKDQKQHVEIARDIAIKFNNTFGETFVIPEAEIIEEVAVIPGIDGQKMSKSYKNLIPIFGDPKVIKKAVMGIITDSKGVDEPKEAKGNTIYELYKLFATRDETDQMAEDFKKGGMGYGDAKKKLLEKITEHFAPFQEKRAYYEAHPKEVEAILKEGGDKVRPILTETMNKVREATGLNY
ncbi:tryptophan--tRNA ligase [Candidatus Peregrinibacteria bacterium]|nr:MAG: tryptophan--tRNA ligase [Candidatus Peregrinibacteria bacterium]